MTRLNWRPYSIAQPTDLKEDWLEWLLYPHSFMSRLESVGVLASTIQVTKHVFENPTQEEAELLNIPSGEAALIREVMIGNSDGQWMFAKTVFPKATLTGAEQQLGDLQNRSLGSYLFKQKAQRGEFEFAKITPSIDWYSYIAKYATLSGETLLARRSQFFIKHKNLLLTEVFLPDMKKIIEKTA